MSEMNGINTEVSIYGRAIEWLAEQDEISTPDFSGPSVSASMIADVFKVEIDQVVQDADDVQKALMWTNVDEAVLKAVTRLQDKLRACQGQ